jgi:hypothetical protein
MKMIEIDEGVKQWLSRQFSGDPQAKAWYAKYKVDPKAAERMVGPRVHKQFIQQYVGGMS